MKIYVASSWRNTFQPGVVEALRADGHEVYDFKGNGDGWSTSTGPGGFHWSECLPGTDWKEWTVEQYLQALEHPAADAGFERDMNALNKADTCVMVMPCGPSASMEMGFAVGAGKQVYVYVPAMREPDLMVKMAGLVTDDLDLIRSCIYADGDGGGNV